MDSNDLRRFDYLRKRAYNSGDRQIAISDMPADLLADRKFVRWLFARDSGSSLKYVSPNLRDDVEIVRAAKNLEFASERLRADPDLVRDILASASASHQFKHASPALRANANLSLFAVVRSSFNSSHIEDSLRSDKNFAISLVSIQGTALEYLPYSLRDDPEVVRAALLGNHSCDALKYATDRNKEDASLVKLAHVSSRAFMSPYEKPWLPSNLLSDKYLAIQGIADNHEVFDALVETLKRDREVQFALISVLNDDKSKALAEAYGDSGMKMIASADWNFDWSSVPAAHWHDAAFARAALWRGNTHRVAQFVATELRADPDFVHSVVARTRTVLPSNWLPDELARDIVLARMCVRYNHDNIAAFHTALCDREFVLSLLRDGYNILRYAIPALRDDREVVLTAADVHGSVIQYASDRLRDDREVVMRAIASKSLFGTVLTHVSTRLLSDRDVVMAAVLENGSNLEYANEAIRADREVVEAAILNQSASINWVAPSLRDDPSIRHLVLAVHKNLEYAGELASDPEIVLDCLANNNGWGFQHVSEKLRTDIAFLRRVKTYGLRPFEHVPVELREKVLATFVESPVYRGRRIAFRVVVRENLDARSQHVIDDVRVLSGGTTLASCPMLPWLEYEEHGPVGSYYNLSSVNGFALLGDFIFFHSARGLDCSRTIETGFCEVGGAGPNLIDRSHELWLVDLPTPGVTLQLTRQKTLDNITGLNLLAKLPGVTHTLAVSLADGDTERLYRGLKEYAGGDSQALGTLAILSGDSLQLNTKKGSFSLRDFGENWWEWREDTRACAISCGGAARVCIDGFGYRWLFPRADGTYTWAEQEERLKKTGDRDDWEVLREHWIPTASLEELEGVRSHFRSSYDAALAAEVRAALRP